MRIIIITVVAGLPWIGATWVSAQEPTHSFMTSSDGVRIHYAELGTGTPVVLIQGYTANVEGKWLTSGIAAAVAQHNRVVAIDARTHRMTRERDDFEVILLEGETPGSAHFNPRDATARVEFVQAHEPKRGRETRLAFLVSSPGSVRSQREEIPCVVSFCQWLA